MITRMKTSKEAKLRLENLNKVLKMSSNAIILRYAIARSLESSKPLQSDPDAEVVDNSGFEITRSTLFGDNEIVYKLLMELPPNSKDEVFFPQITNMHIERGLKYLERDYKIAGNKEKFIKNIISKLVSE